MLTTLMVERKLNWLCIGIFLDSQLGKGEFTNLYYKGFF
jgi:hypothetical protein